MGSRQNEAGNVVLGTDGRSYGGDNHCNVVRGHNMKITEQSMRKAALMAGQISWTDDELAKLITANKLVVAYLQQRGLWMDLATRPLKEELRVLERYMSARQKG